MLLPGPTWMVLPRPMELILSGVMGLLFLIPIGVLLPTCTGLLLLGPVSSPWSLSPSAIFSMCASAPAALLEGPGKTLWVPAALDRPDPLSCCSSYLAAGEGENCGVVVSVVCVPLQTASCHLAIITCRKFWYCLVIMRVSWTVWMSSSVEVLCDRGHAEGLLGVAKNQWGSTHCPCHPMGNSSCFGIPATHKEFLLWQLQGEALAKGNSQLPHWHPGCPDGPGRCRAGQCHWLCHHTRPVVWDTVEGARGRRATA